MTREYALCTPSSQVEMHIDDMQNAGMDTDDRPDFAKRLQLARERRGFDTPKDAARFFGWVYETYIQHEQGIRGISRASERYATAFKVSEAWLLTGEGGMELASCPIVGFAGAGPDGTVLFATGDGNFGEIPAPTNSTPETVALEVRGESMRGIADDGWIITYDDKRAPTEEHLGQPCVCWLADDRVLVKIPYRGRGKRLFDLESTNATTMRDVKVTHMALVTNIIPRAAAQKMIVRDPGFSFEDVILAAG